MSSFFSPSPGQSSILCSLYIFSCFSSGTVYCLNQNGSRFLYDFTIYACTKDNPDTARSTKLYDMWKSKFRDIPARYIAVSESTKQDAVKYWGLSQDKITVIHLGSFIVQKAPRAYFGSKKILIVSDISPRKNHLRLIKAFELVHRANPRSGAELTIVGYLRKDIPEFESTLREIRRRNEGINIRLAGFLTDSEVLSLYAQADVFVYPSLYEGFGLPGTRSDGVRVSRDYLERLLIT